MNTDGYDGVEVSTINATNHGAGYEIIKRAIARAKAALGGGTTDDQAWLATYTNPLYAVHFQTTHQHGVNFEFVQDGVRPPPWFKILTSFTIGVNSSAKLYLTVQGYKSDVLTARRTHRSQRTSKSPI